MFTGIIDHCGVIRKKEGSRYFIETAFNDLQQGESVSVDGICLTVAAIFNQQFCCDISEETKQVSTVRYFKLNQRVHVERALRLQDRLGGHWVMGHVDQVATVASVEVQTDFLKVIFSDILPENHAYLIKKGSISVDGVSLTINKILPYGFEVMLVPHTLERTHLNELKKNSAVNIEFDMMVRVIVARLNNITRDEYHA